MDNRHCVDWATFKVEQVPFPHCYGTDFLLHGIDRKVYEWLTQTDAWSFTEADFYDQFEFSLFDTELPESLKHLVSKDTLEAIQGHLMKSFGLATVQVVGITAHKLVDGQRIAIHNDFIEGEETHRLIIHLNPNWKEDEGGFFMLFNSGHVEDISRIILPIHNSAIGFEISGKSHHAVSEIHGQPRYSIVYTFKAS